MKILFLTLVLAVHGFAIAPSSFAHEWLENIEHAKSLAADSDRLLFLDFTGSDWCAPCIKLRKDYLDQDRFHELVGQKFVFVELDYPKEIEQPEWLVEQNEALKKQYRVSAYPTVIAIDPRGLPVFRLTGYPAAIPSVDAYVSFLEKAVSEYKVAMQLLDNRDLGDTARAKAIDRGLRLLAENGIEISAVPTYRDFVEEIIELDSSGVLGYYNSYLFLLRYEDLRTAKSAADHPQVIEIGSQLVNDFEVSNEYLHEIYYLMYFSYKKMDNNLEAVHVGEKAIELLPEGPHSRFLTTAVGLTKLLLQRDNNK